MTVPDEATPDPIIAISSAAADYTEGDPWASDWVDAYLMRGMLGSLVWDGAAGANNAGTPRIEFSDDGVTVHATTNAFLAMGAPTTPIWNNDADAPCAVSWWPFRWPFLCPYKYARLAGTVSGGPMTLMLCTVSALRNRDADRSIIERVSILPGLVIDPSTTYASDLITGASDVRAALLQCEFAVAIDNPLDSANDLRLVMSPDGTSVFDVLTALPDDLQSYGGAGGANYDEIPLTKRIGSVGYAWGGIARSANCSPMDQIGLQALSGFAVARDTVVSIDIVLFRRPEGDQ